MQVDRKRAAQAQSQPAASSASSEHTPLPPKGKTEPKKRKRESRPVDEIDAVFGALGKKFKKGAPSVGDLSTGSKKAFLYSARGKDQALNDVMDAIRAAPKDDKGRKRT
jgi:nucleolar protein 9